MSIINFRHHHVRPWASSNFLYILWIELRFCMCKAITSMTIRKILLAKTNWFFHVKSSLFDRKSIHSLHLTCHSTSPLSLRIFLPKGTRRLYESLFPRLMDRAEVLHAPSYDLSGRRKNTPGENELVLSWEIFDFQKNRSHSLRSTCHSTCPLPQRVSLSKRTSRLFESFCVFEVPQRLGNRPFP